MKTNYINLNAHSYFSFLQSVLSLEDIVNFAIDNNLKYASLIDINVMYGAFEFYNLCIKNNIKPIIGLNINWNNCDLVLIAKNYNGYLKLLQISSFILCEQNYDLINELNDDLFIISTDNKFQHTNISNLYFASNNELNIRTIACKTVIAKSKDDAKLFKIIEAIKNEQKLSLTEINNYENNNVFLNEDEFKNTYTNEQLINLEKLVSSIDLVIPEKSPINLPKYPQDKFDTSFEYLKYLINSNLETYLNNNKNLDKSNYYKRIQFELEVIEKQNFSDYFLIVQDFINWGKNNDIMIGPGRGSSAGSLIAFLLNITEVDPIKYNLLFERFLNIERLTMPDIDTDIMDIKRDELINYIFNKYKTNSVAHIVTFSRIKAKQAIRDVGRILNIPNPIIDKISKKLTAEYDQDILLACNEINDLKIEYLNNKHLFEFAQKIINFPRQTGVHAAGIVICNNDLSQITGIQKCLDNKIMTQVSMDYLTNLGLVKIDILGLRNITIIYQILKLIKHIHKIDLNLKTINLNDQKVYEILQSGLTSGIFQFESPGMRNVIKQIKPVNLEDLSISSAIYRPGAIKNLQLFLNNRNDENIKYLNEQIKNVLEPTSGVIIYQEQIIKLVQIIAKFDPFKSDRFRVAISKKKEEEINEIKEDFLNNALMNKYSLEDAKKYFENMLDFAKYGFNHSHSLSYSLISYWLTYLKKYFPIESFSIFLTYSIGSKDKINEYIEEAKKFNIDICAPDINLSSSSFVIVKNKLYFSLTAINGLGLETTKKIIELRNKQPDKKFNNAYTALSLISSIGISESIISNLIKSGAFDSLEKNRDQLLLNMNNFTNNKTRIMRADMQYIFKNDINKLDTKNNNYEYEVESLGIGITKSRIDQVFELYKNEYKLIHFNELAHSSSSNILIKINKITKKHSKKGDVYWNLEVTEHNKIYKLLIFHKTIIDKVTENTNNYWIVNIKNDKSYIINKLMKEINYE